VVAGGGRAVAVRHRPAVAFVERRPTVNKRDVLAILDNMPEMLDPEELMYRIYVLQKIEAGEADIRAGRLIPHDEVFRRSKEWLK
jgi:hypothetical protein